MKSKTFFALSPYSSQKFTHVDSGEGGRSGRFYRSTNFTCCEFSKPRKMASDVDKRLLMVLKCGESERERERERETDRQTEKEKQIDTERERERKRERETESQRERERERKTEREREEDNKRERERERERERNDGYKVKKT